ncbi:BrnT family toxin [Methylobacter marinus]|jgi:uncharacterized protein|uniref:BrnT family toxin n=1 Tax=Methylobacter marinus TaxID=34058 RepID=UPI00039FF152|nr:BrnT family toxin [Methylobacter marinus]
MYDFEWDENKNNINRAKHKIDFMDAIQVFFDERRLSKLDREYYQSHISTKGEQERACDI